MPDSHDNILSILSKNLRALCGLCGEYVTAIPARSTSLQWPIALPPASSSLWKAFAYPIPSIALGTGDVQPVG